MNTTKPFSRGRPSLDDKKYGKKKSPLVSFRVDTETAKLLEEVSKNEHNKSEFMRKIMLAGIASVSGLTIA